MKPPFHLVPDELSTDTVEVLEELLDEARKRRIIGIAFAVMYRNREYIVNTAGEARRNPTFTRGMIAALDDRLSEVATSR
jgi:sugar phosphate isomerase/epimerase